MRSSSRFFCVFLLFAVLGKLSQASHFRGGIITWRPISPYSRTVLFDYRLGWRKSHVGSGSWTCSNGCSLSQSATVNVVDYSDEEDWMQGTNNFSYTFSSTGPYTVEFSSCCWISMSRSSKASWLVQTTVYLRYRYDTGTINSSPISAAAPLVRVDQHCKTTIWIPVADPDGDTVRCRFASSSESGFSWDYHNFGTLHQENCTFSYHGNASVGLYPVALQIEDFDYYAYYQYGPLSSIPLQFIISVESNCPCTEQPKFTERTPEDGSCLDIPPGQTLILRVEASCPNPKTSVKSFIVTKPQGMSTPPVETRIGTYGEKVQFVDLTWTPQPSQYGTHIVCFKALDQHGVESEQRCVTLLAGSSSTPRLLSVSRRRTTNFAINWDATFDHKIQKPQKQRYIRFFLDNHEVFKIDTSSSAVSISNDRRTLSFRSPRAVLETYGYKSVILDAGGVVGEGCLHNGPPSERITLASFDYSWGSCERGLRYFASNGQCEDIDECAGQNDSHPFDSSFENFRLQIPASCDYSCINTYRSYRCACMQGYTLYSDDKTCIDINECHGTNGDCSHMCVNLPGTYQCQCPNSAFTMQSDNKTCKAKGLTTTCHAHYMEVAFQREIVNGMNDKNLHLIDPDCNNAEGNWTHVILRAPLSGCGTTQEETSSNIIYYNKVISEVMGGNGAIIRDPRVEISFQCTYSKKKIITGPGIKPWISNITVKSTGLGSFTFKLRLFPDSQYTSAYQEKHYPLTVSLGDRLFAEASVDSTSSDLMLFLDSCMATPSNYPYDFPRYTFLKNGCMNDKTMQYDLKVSSVQRFSIQAFRFVGQHPMVYLHCEMQACLKKNANSRCVKGCLSNLHRRRRDAGDGTKKRALTFGPVMLKKEGETAEPHNNAALGAVSGVACLLLVVLIVLRLRRRGSVANRMMNALGITNNGYV